MSVISMKQLLEAGVHFGHQTRRWNPKMKRFIFTERNGIYIIDLQKTVKEVEKAYYFVRDIAMDNKTVLFVGTKKQAQESIEAEAKRCGTVSYTHLDVYKRQRMLRRQALQWESRSCLWCSNGRASWYRHLKRPW